MTSKSILNSNSNRNSDNVAIWSHITSSLLSSWINEENSQRKLLIIDSRSNTDYESLHINNSINIPYSKIITRKLLNDKISIIELLMKNSTSTYLVEEVINIVVYDKNTEHSNQLVEFEEEENGFAFILLSKIAQKFKSVSFLTGGFIDFKANYSDLCSSNSQIYNNSRPTNIITTSNISTTPILSHILSNVNAEEHFLNVNTPIIVMKNEDINSNTSDKDKMPLTKTIIDKHLVINFKQQKKHVLNHSISSFDTSSQFYRLQTASKQKQITQNTSTFPLDTSSSTLPYNTEKESSVDPKSTSPPISIRDPTKILNYLYLGSQEDALSNVTLNALGITNILNVSISCPKPDFIADANFLRISVNDGHAAKIRPFFDVAYRFIEKCRKANTKVLIHCLAGISRSPTLAIAYLMKNMNLRSDDAYKFVKERRQTISPNFNFLGQLYEYDKILLQQKEQISGNNKTLTENFNEDEKNDENSNTNCSSPNTINKANFSVFRPIKKLKSPCSTSSLNNINQEIQQSDIKFEKLNKQTNSNSISELIGITMEPKIIMNAQHRRKQFIFPFSSNDINLDENNKEFCPKTTQIANISSTDIDKNSLLIQASQGKTLASPSTAFSKFNLNSPTFFNKSNIQLAPFDVNCIHYLNTEINTSIRSNGSNENEKMNLTKTASVNSLNKNEFYKNESFQKNQRPSESFMRRPTNLIMSSLCPTVQNEQSQPLANKNNEPNFSGNSLKRPSSILFDTVVARKNGLDDFKLSDNLQSDTQKLYDNDFRNKCDDINLAKSFSYDSTSSLNNICSCPPSSSLSPLTISILCTSCSNSLTAATAGGCQQTFLKKKMKLSPVSQA